MNMHFRIGRNTIKNKLRGRGNNGAKLNQRRNLRGAMWFENSPTA